MSSFFTELCFNFALIFCWTISQLSPPLFCYLCPNFVLIFSLNFISTLSQIYPNLFSGVVPTLSSCFYSNFVPFPPQLCPNFALIFCLTVSQLGSFWLFEFVPTFFFISVLDICPIVVCTFNQLYFKFVLYSPFKFVPTLSQRCPHFLLDYVQTLTCLFLKFVQTLSSLLPSTLSHLSPNFVPTCSWTSSQLCPNFFSQLCPYFSHSCGPILFPLWNALYIPRAWADKQLLRDLHELSTILFMLTQSTLSCARNALQLFFFFSLLQNANWCYRCPVYEFYY